MNLDKRLYDMLHGWLACVEMLPNETPLDWARRAMSIIVDEDIVLMAVSKEQFERSMRRVFRRVLNEKTF